MRAARHAAHADPITKFQRIIAVSIGAAGFFTWGGVVYVLKSGCVLQWRKETQEVHSVVGGDAERFSVAITVED